MPLPFLLTSSDGNVGGGAYTRLKAPILSGVFTPSTGVALGVEGQIIGALGLVQIGPAVSTGGVRSQFVSTAGVGVASHVYIAQSTAAINTSSGAADAAAPAYSGMGAAIMYDAGRNKIMVFSTVANSWLGTAVLTSS